MHTTTADSTSFLLDEKYPVDLQNTFFLSQKGSVVQPTDKPPWRSIRNFETTTLFVSTVLKIDKFVL